MLGHVRCQTKHQRKAGFPNMALHPCCRCDYVVGGLLAVVQSPATILVLPTTYSVQKPRCTLRDSQYQRHTRVLLPRASQGTAKHRKAEALEYGSGMAPQPMPVWGYFGRTALLYGTLPTRLIYAPCKLCITLSEGDKAKLAESTSATIFTASVGSTEDCWMRT
jgi:hypothetical protein